MNFKDGFEKTALLEIPARMLASGAKIPLKAGKWAAGKVFGKGWGGAVNVAGTGMGLAASSGEASDQMRRARAGYV